MKSYGKLYIFCLCVLIFSVDNLFSEEDLWNGEEYANHSELQYNWATSCIQKLQLLGNERILDIGCGDGRVTASIAKMVPKGHVLGIDTSESMIQVAQKYSKVLILNNINFEKLDAMKLSFNETFDLVVSFNCFHWISDKLAALRGIAKSLKLGGKAFLFFIPNWGSGGLNIKKVSSRQRWKNYFKDFSDPFTAPTPSEFAFDIEQAHLLLKRMEIVKRDDVFPNKVSFVTWLSGSIVYLKYLPKELHQAFLEEIVDCYLQDHPADQNGKIHFVGHRMEVELLKPY